MYVMSNLIFKDLKGYEDKYMMNEEAEIFNKKTMKKLKPYLGNTGYYSHCFYKNGKHKTLHLHRLVASTFLDNINNYPCVDHINRNKLDNSVKNLRWCSYSQNNLNKDKIINKVKIIKAKKIKVKGGICKHYNGKKTSVSWDANIQKNGIRSYKKFPHTDEGLKNAELWLDQKRKELWP